MEINITILHWKKALELGTFWDHIIGFNTYIAFSKFLNVILTKLGSFYWNTSRELTNSEPYNLILSMKWYSAHLEVRMLNIIITIVNPVINWQNH